MNKAIVGILIVVLGLSGAWIFQNSRIDKIDFNADVRPILNKNCLPCHGGVKQLGKLSFLFMEEALKASIDGRKVIVAGNASKSSIFHRITSTDEDFMMPPEGGPLSAAEIETLKKWINQGAKIDDHWAYKQPVKAKGIVKNNVTEGQEIDFFVENKLRENDLMLSPKAEKSVLIRRLSLDLTGLPPTLDQIKEYIADNSEDADEKLVDRLLASPHYGERWAAMWLDLARYADSKGYQKDNIRKEIWRYRDWVINAFNDDMPFDQFTIEQLAGDLLESPSEDQHLATAFHRNTMTNDEGGTDDEEYRVSAVIDRLNTTFEVWQGTTVACVQCHSHPYDPIKHNEYYELYSFFNTTADNDSGADTPKRVLFSPAQREEKEKIEEELLSMRTQGDTVSTHFKNKLEDFLAVTPGRVQVMAEMPEDTNRITRIFIKGNWLSHGDTVQSQTPDFLPEFKKDYSADRLGLAKWLVDGDNPLTSRVIVNRIWEQLFGNGIVTTLEDFGTQGNVPTNQDLLDYLALQFQEDLNWSMKDLIKLIVLSSTYQQTSVVTADLLDKDPYNYLLSRGARFRLPAETIRDQALAVSGLLNRKVYGPSVMPYQPEGVWNVIRHVDQWDLATDGDQHRRGIYTFWRRVSPYPSMITFDVPSREVCVSKRIRTNTPLQALVTMNDPVFVEASEALASRMMKEGGTDVKSQVKYGFKLGLMKDIDNERLDELLILYNSTLQKYSSSEQIMDDGDDRTSEFKTMSLVANVILNLDELIMKT